MGQYKAIYNGMGLRSGKAGLLSSSACSEKETPSSRMRIPLPPALSPGLPLLVCQPPRKCRSDLLVDVVGWDAKLMPSFSAADPSRAPSAGDFFFVCVLSFFPAADQSHDCTLHHTTPVACSDLASLWSFLQSTHIYVLRAYGIKSKPRQIPIL